MARRLVEAVTVAESMEDAEAGPPPAWTSVAGAWLWRGGDWNGEDGVAVLVPLHRL